MRIISYLRVRVFVAYPAPNGCRKGVGTAVDDKHQTKGHWGEIELSQMRLQGGLEKADAHARDYDGGGSHHDTGNFEYLHEFTCGSLVNY